MLPTIQNNIVHGSFIRTGAHEETFCSIPEKRHTDLYISDPYWFFSISVEDSGCLSRIPDPDFYPSRIQDPKTAAKERGEKNLLSNLFL
jgi:hypothetical protein